VKGAARGGVEGDAADAEGAMARDSLPRSVDQLHQGLARGTLLHCQHEQTEIARAKAPVVPCAAKSSQLRMSRGGCQKAAQRSPAGA
jgi:hypothetical protein